MKKPKGLADTKEEVRELGEDPSQERQVAKRIEELERKLGEAQKKLSKVEVDDKGKAQPPPTLAKG